MAGERPWRLTADGLTVAVRLTPRGGRDAIENIETLADGRAVLIARVRAAPTEGEANAALLKLFAKSLKLPASRLAIASGAASRVKVLAIEGDGAMLAVALERLIEG